MFIDWTALRLLLLLQNTRYCLMFSYLNSCAYCFSNVTGVFSPPVHGLYSLTTSILSLENSRFSVYLKRNDEILCKSYAERKYVLCNRLKIFMKFATDRSLFFNSTNTWGITLTDNKFHRPIIYADKFLHVGNNYILCLGTYTLKYL